MEKRSHDKDMHQPSLFSYVTPIVDKELNIDEKTLDEIPYPNDYYIALDHLLDALEELLHNGYPLCDELRHCLSNPTLETVIFDEMTRSLGFG